MDLKEWRRVELACSRAKGVVGLNGTAIRWFAQITLLIEIHGFYQRGHMAGFKFITYQVGRIIAAGYLEVISKGQNNQPRYGLSERGRQLLKLLEDNATLPGEKKS